MKAAAALAEEKPVSDLLSILSADDLSTNCCITLTSVRIYIVMLCGACLPRPHLAHLQMAETEVAPCTGCIHNENTLVLTATPALPFISMANMNYTAIRSCIPPLYLPHIAASHA